MRQCQVAIEEAALMHSAEFGEAGEGSGVLVMGQMQKSVAGSDRGQSSRGGRIRSLADLG